MRARSLSIIEDSLCTEFEMGLLRTPDLHFGPKELLTHFLKVAARSVRDRGIELCIRRDFDAFVEFKPQARSPRQAIIPFFHPGSGLLTGDNAFWIEGRNEHGETVIVQAARFFDWTGTNLDRELRSLRAVYADPMPKIEAGEVWDVRAPSGKSISGRTVYSGGAWFHPEYRGIGLSRILPRISRCYALGLWGSTFTFSLIEPILTRKGVVQSYGYTQIEQSVCLKNSIRSEITFDLVWMHREELIRDIETFLTSGLDRDFARAGLKNGVVKS